MGYKVLAVRRKGGGVYCLGVCGKVLSVIYVYIYIYCCTYFPLDEYITIDNSKHIKMKLVIIKSIHVIFLYDFVT